jgi:hypothetical protein
MRLRITPDEGVREDTSWRHEWWPSPQVEDFVVSYPKSGRTWLRALLSAAEAASRSEPVLEVMHEWLQTEAPRLRGRRVLFTHALAARAEPSFATRLFLRYIGERRRVFLVRDPRDVVVSRYFQVTRRSRDSSRAPADLASFVRDPDFGLESVLRFAEDCDESLREDPGPALLVSYEELHRAAGETLRVVFEFLSDAALDENVVADAVSFASFGNLRRLEADGVFDGRYERLVPGDRDDPESFKVRRGEMGGYRRYLAPDDVAWIEERIAALQPSALGYLEPGAPPARVRGSR